MKDVLLLNPTALIDPIRLVLEGSDEQWQFNRLSFAVRLPHHTQSMLRVDLEAFSTRISYKSNLAWDLRSDVKQVLNRMAT